MFYEKMLPDEIIDKLYLGNMNHAENINGLNTLKISHILVSANWLKPVFPEVSHLFIQKFKYKTIKIDDSPRENIKMYFEETHNFIKEGITTGTGVLVHWYFNI